MNVQIKKAYINDSAFTTDLNRFSKFRRYSNFTILEKEKLLKNQYKVLLDNHNNTGLFLEIDSVLSAIAIIEPCLWDSQYFSKNMARLHLFSKSCVDKNKLSKLISNAIELASSIKIEHISIEVDIDDYITINSLINFDFEILDVKRSYFTHKYVDDNIYKKMMLNIRSYTSHDIEEVSRILDMTYFDTRFTRDTSLVQEKAQSLYREWFYKLINEHNHSSNVVVYIRRAKVVACGAIGEFDFKSFGIDRMMRVGSIYACLPSGIGAYGAVLQRLTQDAISSHGFVETTVSLNNVAATRVVEGVRPNQSNTALAMRLLL